MIEIDEEHQVMGQRLLETPASDFARKILFAISIAGFVCFSAAALHVRRLTPLIPDAMKVPSKDSSWEPLSPEQSAALMGEIRRSGASPCRFAIVYNCTDNCVVIADSIYKALQSAECLGAETQFQDFAAQQISGIIVTPGILGSDDTPAWEMEGALEGIGLPVREEDAGSGSIMGEPYVQIIVSNKPHEDAVKNRLP